MFYVKLVDHEGNISWADSTVSYKPREMTTHNLETAMSILGAWAKHRRVREVSLMRAPDTDGRGRFLVGGL